MVNHGASKGCSACRKRRIKCDVSRPSCKECSRRNESCPGYLDRSQSLRFRSQNAVVERKYKSGATIQVVVHQPSLTNIDVHQLAVCQLFDDYVVQPIPRLSPGWLSSLPDLFAKAGKDSILKHAVQAAAYVNYGRTSTNASSLPFKAVQHNLTAIRLIKSTLNSPQPLITDDIMTAILVLVLYEYMSSTHAGELSLHHSNGLGVLAQFWSSPRSGYGQSDLLPIVCCQTARRNVDLGLMPTAENEKLLNCLDKVAIANRMPVFFHQLARYMSQSSSVNISNKRHLLAHVLETDLRSWFCDAHPIVSVSEHPSWTPYDASKPTKQSTYRDLYLASLWNKGRALRLLIHQKLLQLPIQQDEPAQETSEHSNHSSFSRPQSLAIIDEMVNEILDSVSFSLESSQRRGNPQHHKATPSVGAYFLLWPLKVIMQCPFISTVQRVSTTAVLLRIGSEFGIGFATGLARKSEVL